MLKGEYDALMGYESSVDEYMFAQAVYNLSDLDKRRFCSIWKDPAVRDMMDPIYNKIDFLEKENMKLKKDLSYWIIRYKSLFGIHDALKRQIKRSQR